MSSISEGFVLSKVTSFAATMGLIVATIANLPNSYLGVAVPGWGGLAAARRRVALFLAHRGFDDGDSH